MRRVQNEQQFFCAQLREYRQLRGMSQTELAVRAKLHRTYISELERGRKSPTLQTMLRLAYALEIEVWQLISNR